MAATRTGVRTVSSFFCQVYYSTQTFLAMNTDCPINISCFSTQKDQYTIFDDYLWFLVYRLKRAKTEEFDFLVASHTLAELYAVLTTLPVRPRILPGTAWRLVHENVETTAKVVSLSWSDYSATIKYIADLGLSGGIIYDALIAKAAKKEGGQASTVYVRGEALCGDSHLFGIRRDNPS